MDNALSFDFLQYARSDIKYLQAFPFPALICDRSLRIYWKNTAATEKRESLQIIGDLPRILAGVDVARIFRALEEQGSFTMEDVLPLSSASLHFTPIYADEAVAGAAILISGDFAGYGKNHGSAGTSAALARGLRQDVSHIFDALDDAFIGALKMDSSDWLSPHFNRINAGAYGILRTAVNVSTYARLQNAEMEPQFTAVDIYNWLAEIQAVIGTIFGAAQIPVTLTLSDEVTYLRLDSELFEIAFFNILHNSMTYSRPGNAIHISAAKECGSIIISVADKGCGMTEEVRAQAHRPYFFRQQLAVEPGLGLGLALAKGLTELQNGTLEIRSQEDVGTEVLLRFPNDSFARGLPLAQREPWEEPMRDNRFSYLHVGLLGGLQEAYRPKNETKNENGNGTRNGEEEL